MSELAEKLPLAAALEPLPEVLCGRYRIERLLGVGGMGAVYRARDLLSEQFGEPQPWLALKTLSDEFAEYPDAHALLYGEYALTRRLRHANVVRPFAFEVDRQCQRAFITLELLNGPTLDEVLAEHPQGLDWQALQSIALPLLDALGSAHAQGITHGDLKPSNVILCDDGLRLIDFGLGQASDGLLAELPRLARQRVTAWTTRYAALELIEGGELTPACDLYALACLLYELATGKHPYRRLSAKQARAMDLEAQLEVPEHLPAACWQALRGALALEAQQRQGDVPSLRQAFLSAVPAGWWQRLRQRRGAR